MKLKHLFRQHSIKQCKEKPVIAIAHRLSTISTMDRIIVLEEGKIVEEGTHDNLLNQDSLYSKFWKRQSGGFTGSQKNQMRNQK